MIMKIRFIQDKQVQRRIMKKFSVLKTSTDPWLERLFEKEILQTIKVEVVR